MQAHLPPRRILASQLEATLREHEELMAVVEGLVEATDPAEARLAGARLRTALSPHFAEEEEPDGVFCWMGALDPGCREALHELREEHGAILALMEALLEGPEEEVLSTARALADRIRAHERREVALLERVVRVG